MVTPATDLHMVISWVGFSFMKEFLEEVAGVAVHVIGTWLNKSLPHIVDDLISQRPLLRVVRLLCKFVDDSCEVTIVSIGALSLLLAKATGGLK